MNYFVEIKNSKINGKGLFSLKDFSKGEEIYVLKKGRIITAKEIENLSDLEKLHLDKIGDDQFEIIEEPGCYINHSCNSNVEEKNRKGIALRTIKKGEEITIDYEKIAYLEESFECHCGVEKCRKSVKGKV
ncbi:MAG: SET domain-containing protein [Patescibacteria group bacterium]|nr:SET domain-containing protein [Patescibacteria group bacterium]